MQSTARLCDVVQLAIIDGVALDEPQRIHRNACAECRFLADMSRGFSQVAGGARGSGVFGAGINAALDHAMASGEALFGRYRLEALCGRGGQGVVYRALDLETRELVAVKLVRAGGDSEREAGNARRIRHPNVCGVYHTEHQSDLRLIVMEWIDGPTLADCAGALGAAPLEIVRAICAGVAAAHAEGVLHLDLKPSNVLLRSGREPVVTDFGLSVRQSDSEVRAAGGTPRYMAPEQLARGAVDKRSDVYALGRLAEELIPRPSRRVRRAIRQATALDPARRFSDAAAFGAALAPRRWRGMAAAVGVGTLLAIAGLMFIAYPVRGPRATWNPKFLGPDLIPASAWNVARNVKGEGLPRVVVEEQMFGAGQQPYELLDGVAQYDTWEHGVAFVPAPSKEHPDYSCVSLDSFGGRETLSDDDRLCEFDDVRAHFTLHPGFGRDLPSISPERRRNLGKAIPRRPCGERAIRIELDDVYQVFAVRAWHHGASNVPHHFRIEVYDEAQRIHPFEVVDNWQGTDVVEEHGGWWYSAGCPVTSHFAPVQTRLIRYVIDTCSTVDTPALVRMRRTDREHGHPTAGDAAPGHGWFYEIEVFAPLSRWDEWRRFLRGH